MRIGTIYPSFVYNTNTVSRKSLGRISAIPEDVLQSKVDYAGGETINPLSRGESRDLAGILASQMAMSGRNAVRVMKEQSAPASMQKASMQVNEQTAVPEQDLEAAAQQTEEAADLL